MATIAIFAATMAPVFMRPRRWLGASWSCLGGGVGLALGLAHAGDVWRLTA